MQRTPDCGKRALACRKWFPTVQATVESFETHPATSLEEAYDLTQTQMIYRYGAGGMGKAKLE